MTNAEAVDLCQVLGVPVKSHSSSLNEAYSDMVRRRAIRDGLTRAEQPPEPQVETKVKKTAAKSTAAKATTANKVAAHADTVVEEAPVEAPAEESVVDVTPVTVEGNGAPAVETVPPEQVPAPAEPVAETPEPVVPAPVEVTPPAAPVDEEPPAAAEPVVEAPEPVVAAAAASPATAERRISSSRPEPGVRHPKRPEGPATPRPATDRQAPVIPPPAAPPRSTTIVPSGTGASLDV